MIGYDAWKTAAPDPVDGPHAERIETLVLKVQEEALGMGISKKHTARIVDDLRDQLLDYAADDFEPELHEE